MNYDLAKLKMRSSLGRWYSKRDKDALESVLKSKYYNKLVNCGNKRFTPTGSPYLLKCSSALCARCSSSWGRKQADALIRSFPHSRNEDYVFITVVIALKTDIKQIFPTFNKFRTDVRNDVNNFRNRKGEKFRPWDQFGVKGSLEIDCFKASEFNILGSEKQKQYVEKLGYKYESYHKFSSSNVWIVTGHFVVHRRSLATGDIEALFGKHAKHVYSKEFDKSNSRDFNIRTILRYSSKVQFGTKISGGMVRYWSNETIREYASIMLGASGRNKFKFSISKKGMRTRRSISRATLKEAV